MSAQLISWLSDFKTFFPVVSFMAGLGGSLHCVGMCGGLVTATCDKKNDVFRYQMGRLLGYLTLGALAGVLGSFLTFNSLHPVFNIIPSLIIGGLFIFWGLKNFQGKRAEVPTPKFLGKIYHQLWNLLVKGNANVSKAFFTGLISVFLPCGLLYGIVLGTLSLSHFYEALPAMFFFWLGTVPSMVSAPSLIRKVIRPFQSKLPKTFGVGLMVIGLLTVSLRMVKFYKTNQNSQDVAVEKLLNCH